MAVVAPIADKMLRAVSASEAALNRVIASPDGRAPDMGGKLGTDAFEKRVALAVE